MCGDSASEDDVRTLMRNDIASLMATDPPYGVRFGEGNYNPRAKQWDAIEGDARDEQGLRSWFASVLHVWLPRVRRDSTVYVWGAPLSAGHRLYEAIEDVGLHVQGQIIWVKDVFALGQADFQWCHEICWYAFFRGQNHRWYGGRDKRTTWQVKKVANSAYLHPAQKPVELYERPIEYGTLVSDVVAEPFCGSGTQIIAAEKLDRTCLAMEIDQTYCDVSLTRWAAYTGRDPVRESDGVTWSSLKENSPAGAGLNGTIDLFAD